LKRPSISRKLNSNRIGSRRGSFFLLHVLFNAVKLTEKEKASLTPPVSVSETVSEDIIFRLSAAKKMSANEDPENMASGMFTIGFKGSSVIQNTSHADLEVSSYRELEDFIFSETE
jgi:hypothetical protein